MKHYIGSHNPMRPQFGARASYAARHLPRVSG